MGLFDHIRDFRGFTKESLEKLDTRELLKLLDETRRIPEWEYFFGVHDDHDDDFKTLSKYRKTLKDILSTREHIPNKLESKEIRLNKVKNKNNNGKQIRKR
jgi:hypothetical protein